ncbi:hypothetical protein WJX72_003128 [[Myrmecia] bisecta]|uniref:Xylose isomerase-like TIM barrel domain-containing protein n=1 Tax=[Myrmecia] bisecta TaxID=41462 RepID=A0AAW1Q7G0_9CHLO
MSEPKLQKRSVVAKRAANLRDSIRDSKENLSLMSSTRKADNLPQVPEPPALKESISPRIPSAPLTVAAAAAALDLKERRSMSSNLPLRKSMSAVTPSLSGGSRASSEDSPPSVASSVSYTPASRNGATFRGDVGRLTPFGMARQLSTPDSVASALRTRTPSMPTPPSLRSSASLRLQRTATPDVPSTKPKEGQKDDHGEKASEGADSTASRDISEELVAAQRERDALRSSQSQLQAELQKYRSTVASLQSESSSLRSNCTVAETTKSVSTKVMLDLTQQTLALNAEKNELRELLEQQSQEMESLLAERDSRHQAAHRAAEASLRQVEEMDVEVARLKGDLAYRSDELARAKGKEASMARELEGLRGTRHALDTSLRTARQDLQVARQQVDTLNSAAAALREEQAAGQQQVAELERQVQAEAHARAQGWAQLANVEEQLRQAEAQAGKQSKLVSSLEAQVASQAARVASLLQEAQQAVEARRGLEEELDIQSHKVASLARELEAAEEHLALQLAAKARLEAELQARGGTIAAMSAQIEQAGSKARQLEQQLATKEGLEAELAARSATVASMSAQIQQAAKKAMQLEQQLEREAEERQASSAAMAADLEAATQKVTQLEEQLSAVTAAKAVLEEQLAAEMAAKVQVEQKLADSTLQVSSLASEIQVFTQRAQELEALLQQRASEGPPATPYSQRHVPRKWVGAHVSMAGGIEKAVVHASAIGAHAFALDTRSKRRWDCPPISDTSAAAFRAACEAFGFNSRQILPHGSYLINLGSPDPDMVQKSYAAFLEEIQRCETLGLELYNFHPGSTCGLCSEEESMDRIAAHINKAHAATDKVIVVLENTAGQGKSVGHKFAHLRYIIDRVQDKARIGVCIDTCHAFAAGYDVSTSEGLKATMQEFDEVVGLQYLRGMHLNDSKTDLGSRKDRHENLGRGRIGLACFTHIMNDSRFDGIPLIMETPVQCSGPKLNYKKSLQEHRPVFRQTEEEAGQSTDCRDIAMLYSLCT